MKYTSTHTRGDTHADRTKSVPPVPGVPVAALSWENTGDTLIHYGDTHANRTESVPPVPGVPVTALSWENTGDTLIEIGDTP